MNIGYKGTGYSNISRIKELLFGTNGKTIYIWCNIVSVIAKQSVWTSSAFISVIYVICDMSVKVASNLQTFCNLFPLSVSKSKTLSLHDHYNLSTQFSNLQTSNLNGSKYLPHSWNIWQRCWRWCLDRLIPLVETLEPCDYFRSEPVVLSFSRGSGSMWFDVEWDPPEPGKVYMHFPGQLFQYYRGNTTYFHYFVPLNLT